MKIPTLHLPSDPPPTPHDQGRGAYSDPVDTLVHERRDGRDHYRVDTMVYVGESGGNAAGWYLASTRTRAAPPAAWISEREEDRRDVQNRLLHRWCGQIDKSEGHERGYTFGRTKLDLLLPMKLADDNEHERAVYEKGLIDGGVAFMLARDESGKLNARELRIEAAKDVIRSRDIRVRLFAEWLTAIQQQAAEQGVVLLSSEDERKEALYEKAVDEDQSA